MSSDLSSIYSQDKINSPKLDNNRIYEFENFRLDAARLMLYKDEKPISLAPKVVETLVALVERSGEVVSKNELMNRLWANSFVEESNLTQNIYLLRKALGNTENGEAMIESFRRRGYRFNGVIRDKAARQDGNEAIEKQPTEKNAVPSGAKTKWIAIVAAACGLMILALLLILLAPRFFNRPVQTDASSITLKRLTPDIYAIYSAISPDGKYLVYVQSESGKRSIWLKDIVTGSAKQIMPPGEEYGAVRFSPDGSRIYFITARNNRSVIVCIPFAGGTPQEITQETTSPFTVSPDGKQIAFVREQSLIIADTYNKSERTLSQRDLKTSWFESWGSQLSWSPDGNSIAICGGRHSNGKPRYVLTEISVSDASERDIPVPDWDYLDSVQWIPDRSGLIVIARETSGSPFQIWRVAYPKGETTRITQDLQSYNSVSISADSRLMVATQGIGNRNIWIAPAADLPRAKQITFGAAANDGYQGVALAADGRIVYTSPRGGNWDLWIMNADGSNQKQLTANVGKNLRPIVTPDCRYIFFQSDRQAGSGGWRIWRIDMDGGNPKQMTEGEGAQYRPAAASDGQWIYFTLANGTKSSIWKIPVEGGKPVRISPSENIGLHSASPDGKLLAIEKYDKDAKIQWQQGVMRADTGDIVRWFDQPLITAGHIDWTADSTSLIFLEFPSFLNLWLQPVDGSAARPLTNFDSGQLSAFDISPDGKTIVVSRGNSSTEAVLISGF